MKCHNNWFAFRSNFIIYWENWLVEWELGQAFPGQWNNTIMKPKVIHGHRKLYKEALALINPYHNGIHCLTRLENLGEWHHCSGKTFIQLMHVWTMQMLSTWYSKMHWWVHLNPGVWVQAMTSEYDIFIGHFKHLRSIGLKRYKTLNMITGIMETDR